MLAQAVAVTLGVHEIFTGHEADGPLTAKLVGQSTGDDIHFVETCACDQQVAPLYASLFQHAGARPTTGQELHIERTEPVGDGRGVVYQG